MSAVPVINADQRSTPEMIAKPYPYYRDLKNPCDERIHRRSASHPEKGRSN